jgi:hypothetical protein
VKKLLLSLGTLGAAAALVIPAALAAGGAQTIAAAPTLPVGVKVGHAYTLPGCTGYGEIWRLNLLKGDHLTLAYGSKDGNQVEVLLLDPKATDNSNSDSEVLASAWTQFRDDLTFNATKSGKYTLIVRTNYPCQKSLYYFMRATVQHATKA